MREGVARTQEGAAALVPGGRPEERAATDGPERTSQAERRLRLQGLAGMTVLGSDGKTVGRVRDIYQQDSGGKLAAITVMPRQLSARSVLIPSAAIAALPAEHPADGADPADGNDPVDSAGPTDAGPADAGNTDPADGAEAAGSQPADVVRLRIDTATATSGLRPPDTGHATPQMLREAAEALGLATDDADVDAPATRGARKAAEDA
ncbi:MAG: PRC-barrel domain-containing protein [Brachybacterium sp.]|uniref:PRC-barrel domain-containing protein n=1 Tax=unclassified Brachybacterium TaxID=2623841 RepID=UPI003F8DB1F0